jgi:hypothetical protein
LVRKGGEGGGGLARENNEGKKSDDEGKKKQRKDLVGKKSLLVGIFQSPPGIDSRKLNFGGWLADFGSSPVSCF